MDRQRTTHHVEMLVMIFVDVRTGAHRERFEPELLDGQPPIALLTGELEQSRGSP